MSGGNVWKWRVWTEKGCRIGKYARMSRRSLWRIGLCSTAGLQADPVELISESFPWGVRKLPEDLSTKSWRSSTEITPRTLALWQFQLSRAMGHTSQGEGTTQAERCRKPLAWQGTGFWSSTLWMVLGNVSKAPAASPAITMKTLIAMKLFVRSSYR